MSLLLSNLTRTGAILAVLVIALGWHRERVHSDRNVSVVLDAGESRRLCALEGYPESYFWERFHTMGGRIGLLRTQPLDEFIQAGRAIRFSAGEIERLRASGAAAEDAPLSPDSIWTEEEALAGRFERAAAAAGVALKATPYRGRRVFSAPAGFSLSGGFDPARIEALRTAGLLPAYAVASPFELRLALEDTKPAVLWIEGGWDGWSADDIARLSEGLREHRFWIAWSEDWVPSYRTDHGRRRWARGRRDAHLRALGIDRVRRAGRLTADAGAAAAVAAARGGRVLLFQTAGGVEDTLRRWRERFRRFRGAGLGAGPLARTEPIPLSPWWERVVRRIFGGLVLLLGPLAAIRAAAGVQTRWRNPFAAYAGVVLAACFFGWLGRSGASLYDVWISESYRAGDPIWAFLVLGVAAAAYRSETARYRGGFLLGAAAIGLFWSLPQASPALGEWFGRRWLEIAIGGPALLMGLRLASGVPGRPPGPWLFFGTMVPIGLVQAVSDARIPVEAALPSGLAAALLGAALGGVILGVERVFQSR